MLVQYASDLHLEFPQNKKFLYANPLKPSGKVLVLAGDIVPFSLLYSCQDFFSYVSDHFETTYWVPGNHEYYYYDMANKSGSFNESIRSNVHLVNNVTVYQNEIRFIFSTLWSKISPINQWQTERRMSDFQVIEYNGSRFSAQLFNQVHEESMQFVASELALKTPKQTVVVTHHIPTFLNYPDKYKGDPLNEAFASEQFGLIEAVGPDYWIYGHHHENMPDFRIGKTQLLTNQLGYVKYREHKKFDGGKTFDLL